MIPDVRAERLTTSVRLNLFMSVALGLTLGGLVHQTRELHMVRADLTIEKIRAVMPPAKSEKFEENIDKRCVAWLFNENMKAAITRACGRTK